MLGDFKMLRTVLSFASICSVVLSSGVHHFGAPIAEAPIVTAASSQYFERTFNRLIAAPPLVPVAPPPPVFVQPQALPVPLPQPQAVPFQPVQPVQRVPVQPIQPQPVQPVEPNVAIAIATAHAAPVATILLPPYPFGFPPGFGFVPQEQPSSVDEKTLEPEQTTTKTTTQVEVKTTQREPETTTPLPAASDNSFAQASSQDANFRQYLAPALSRPQAQPTNLDVNFRQYGAPEPPRPQPQPSNQNTNFRQYLAPAPQLQRPQVQLQPQPSHQALPYALPQPLPHHHNNGHHHPNTHVYLHPIGKPQKLKTFVEVVKAPLAYIAPPSLPQYSHNHEAVKVVKHVHTFVPAKAKLIIRPVTHHHTRSVPVKVIEYKRPFGIKAAARVQNVNPDNSREAEFTTFSPFPRPQTKPPRL